MRPLVPPCRYRAVGDPPPWTLRILAALHIKLLHLLLLLDAHLGAHGSSAPQRTQGGGAASTHASNPTRLHMHMPACMRDDDGGSAGSPNSHGGSSRGAPGGAAALLPLDSLLAHRAARLFWMQHFGRHEAVVRWRELRDALQQDFGKMPHGVLHEIRAAAQPKVPHSCSRPCDHPHLAPTAHPLACSEPQGQPQGQPQGPRGGSPPRA